MIRTIYLLTLKNDSECYDLNSSKIAAEVILSFFCSCTSLNGRLSELIKVSAEKVVEAPLHI